MIQTSKNILLVTLLAFFMACGPQVREVLVADGWSQNSVNTVIFRKNSLYTYQNTQCIGFYDPDGQMIVGKRQLTSTEWTLKKTGYFGNTHDAHNSISLIVDGDGYLHVSWDHHNTSLRYVKSKTSGSLDLDEEMSMIDSLEGTVSYPEFYSLPDGNLLFFYRDGGSGNGNLVINKYNLNDQKWIRVQNNLISGEGERNAYWQAYVDEKGVVHLSWVWRESPDVASNHDLCYARSEDDGITWQKTNGDEYSLPITASTAEYVTRIPQKSELINQTSMTATKEGNPIIVSYWKPVGSEIPQFHIAFLLEGQWQISNLGFRTQPFSLSGIGTKAIPISRPQVVAAQSGEVFVIFRDAERSNKISVATSTLPLLQKWRITDLTKEGYPSWEPTLDPSLWSKKETLHLFLQDVKQIDGEGLAETDIKPVKVLECKP